ncbi:MAG TPA: GYD domain-containing protein [Methanoregula sp.]|nr:GYD domain-containing protein [Methanoregula sp.]
MPVYVMLGHLTHAAFDKIDRIDERDRKAKEIIESLGGKLIALYYTFGQYDFVAIFEMPEKEKLVKLLTIVGKFGTVRTETLETIPTEMLYKVSKEV